ncbi:MAG: acylphosphatase [Chitinophagales bacterium]|nr:acylphosphatase [Chitinophagales bacterium]
MQTTLSIIVSGKVQGVFYRQHTKDTAKQLNITGEVKNMPNGTVSIIATGTKEQLEKLVAWCKDGSPKAVVTDIIINELPLQEFDHFIITRY